MDQGVAHSHRITLDAFLAFSCPWGSEISTALKGSVARKTCFGESRHQFLQLWDSKHAPQGSYYNMAHLSATGPPDVYYLSFRIKAYTLQASAKHLPSQG